MKIHPVHYNRKEYREEYLRSEEWRQKSSAILQRDPICRICDKDSSSDSHHLTYERIHHELPSDLIGICRTCHNIIHRHPELKSISNIEKLRTLFPLIRKGGVIDKETMDRIGRLSLSSKMKVMKFLKVNERNLSLLLGCNIGYYRLKQLLGIINKLEHKGDALLRKLSKREELQKRINKSDKNFDLWDKEELCLIINRLVRKNVGIEFSIMSLSEQKKAIADLILEVYYF